MPGSWRAGDFPNLSDSDWVKTSDVDRRYNCIAWAAGNNSQKWWPDQLNIGYWPPNVSREETVASFIQAYGTLGYEPCQNGSLEPNFVKIALYAESRPGGEKIPTHAARQLADGNWTSKLGDCEDITHFTLETLQGPIYGAVACFLRRPVGH